MSLRCLFGLHTPSLSAIARRPSGYVTLCDNCARPLHRHEHGRWEASDPLDAKPERANAGRR